MVVSEAAALPAVAVITAAAALAVVDAAANDRGCYFSSAV
jgi:hypothetical protein